MIYIFVNEIRPRSFLSLLIDIPIFSVYNQILSITEIPSKEQIMQETLHRNIFQRLFGICATKEPSDPNCWTFENGKISIDLNRTPELASPDSAIRLEKKNLPERVLVFKGTDDQYHAIRNACTHMKRRLDPVPGVQQVQCCSIGKSTYTYEGENLSGLAKGPLHAYPVSLEENKLVITL